jgi:ParB/RepB/Spo0J family partition protein
MKLTEHAVTAAPLLIAISGGGDLSNAGLAKASGRQANNMARDLANLAKTGWILREPGSSPALTDEGRAILAALARAEGEHQADAAAVELALHLIDENPDNPRQGECDEADDELTASIGKDGVLQPIMVRPYGEDGRYMVVMGARRRRCAIAAGRLTLPCVVRDLDDAKAFEIATIENLQREDMNPLDEARAFKRIVDDRLVADPTLKLREAKEVIAQATGKSVRFVELRLQLLDLSPVLQVEIAIGVTTPKDAIQRQRHAPKLNPKITPRQWLILVEVFDKAKREPTDDSEWSPKTLCRQDARLSIENDPDASLLLGAATNYMLNRPSEIYEHGEDTGRQEVGIHSSAVLQLRLLAADRLGIEEPDLDDDQVRANLLAALRSAAFSDEPFDLRDGEYLTDWLNGPFDPSPELLAEIEARREGRRQQEEQHRAAIAERDSAAEQRRQRTERDNGEPGRALLSAVDHLEADAAGLSIGAFQARYAEILASYEIDGPYRLDAQDGDQGRIVDGAGVATEAAGPAMEARRRLICIAMNFAAGLSATSGERYAAPWRDADGQITAPEPPEAPTPSAAEADDDADDDIEQFDEEDEDESPAFLRRLAGGEPEAARS